MLNYTVLMGRLTRDPELKQTNEISRVNFSIAVDREYKKDGQKETDFFDVVAWRSTADFICKYFQKGQMIVVEGRLQKRSYEDTNGNKKEITEMIADQVHFCGFKSQSDTGTSASSQVSNGFVPFPDNFPANFNQQPQYHQPNMQPAPTAQGYRQAPPQQQAPVSQAAPADVGIPFHPEEWEGFTPDDHLPF